jgi:EAL domain-containing protein (putative c-di-GMP-specific phosphodiesterase class I)
MAFEREGDMELPEPGAESPLDAAIAQRDGNTLAMVRNAIRRRAVMLAFQPVVQSRRHQSAAFYEGLIRVMDETGRVIPAREFIGTAETNETGRVLDCLALEMGFAALTEEPSLRLSINMSARSIGYPRWMNTLRQGLDMDATAGERLILEITESSAMAVPDIVTPFMKSLQRAGVSFALDDFGAGFTSFRYLREFYFDAIKIDGQFIKGIHHDADNQCLTRALISIAEHFDMFTVAEGVEAAADAAFLTSLGIDCQQGYYFGAPTTMPPWRADRERQRAG